MIGPVSNHITPVSPVLAFSISSSDELASTGKGDWRGRQVRQRAPSGSSSEPWSVLMLK